LERKLKEEKLSRQMVLVIYLGRTFLELKLLRPKETVTIMPDVYNVIPLSKVERKYLSQQAFIRYRRIKHLEQSSLSLDDELFLENLEVAIRLWGVSDQKAFL
jgi:hypothetical protein